MKEGIEALFERETNAKLKEYDGSIRGDFDSLEKGFTFYNEEITTKLKQSDDKFTLLNSDVQSKIAKTTLNFANRNSALEDSLFLKVENGFEESISKINALEDILADSVIKSSNATNAAKKDMEVELKVGFAKLEEFSSSIQKNMGSAENRLASLHNEIDKKLTQNDNKITLLSSDLQSKFSQEIVTLSNKNNALEESLSIKFEYVIEEYSSKLDQLEKSVATSTVISSEAADAVKKNLEIGLVESLDKLEIYNSSIREDYSALKSIFTSSTNEINTKLKQSDDKLNLLNSDLQNRIAKTTLNFACRNSALEESLFLKVENGFEESIGKLNALENLVTDSVLNSSKASDAVKMDLAIRLEELDSALRTEINAVIGTASFFNKEFDEKLQQSDDKIILLSSNLQNIMSKTVSDISSKNKDLEEYLSLKVQHGFEENISKFNNLELILADSVKSSSKASDILKKDLDSGLVASLDKLEEYKISIREDIGSAVSEFVTANNEINRILKQNDDKIILLKSDVQNRIAKATLNSSSKNSELESFLLQKLEKVSVALETVDSKIGKNVSDLQSVLEKDVLPVSNSQEEKIKKIGRDLNILQNKFQADVGKMKSLILDQGVSFGGSVADYEIKFDNKIIEQTKQNIDSFNSLKRELDEFEGSFNTTFNKKIDDCAGDVQELKKYQDLITAGLANEIEGISLATSDSVLNESIEVRKLVSEEVICLTGEISNLSASTQKKNVSIAEDFNTKISAITDDLDKTSANHKNQFNELKSVIFEENQTLIKDLKENIEGLHVMLGESSDMLSTEFTTLIQQCRETISHKVELPQVESFFNHEIDEKLKAFSSKMGDRFQTIDKSIQLVETMIVREEDLTELFQNYTLNVNIAGNRTL